MILFQDETQKLAKFAHFEIYIFIQKLLIQNIWHIEVTICIFNKKLQKVSLKKIKSYEKVKNDYKNTQILFIK
jgi:hypothetical protein